MLFVRSFATLNKQKWADLLVDCDLVIRKWTAAAHFLKTIALLTLMTPFYTDICKCVRITTIKASENVLQLDLQSKFDSDMFIFTYHIPDMSI